MAKQPVAPTATPAAAPPGAPPVSPSSDEAWHDPGDDNDLNDKQNSAIAIQQRKGDTAPDANKPPAAQPEPGPDANHSAAPTGDSDKLQSRIKELEAQLAEAKQAKPAREPLKLDLDDSFDEPTKKSFLSLVEQLNQRDSEREKEHQAALQKLSALEADNQLSKEERALTKMLDALPNDHFREVFAGEDSNDNYHAAAKKVKFLREAYKASGDKVPSERALFAEAARILFSDKAEEIRARGGRPRKDRAINRVTPATTAPAEYGVQSAKQHVREFLVRNGVGVLHDQQEELGYD